VFTIVADPVGAGFVDSMARPDRRSFSGSAFRLERSTGPTFPAPFNRATVRYFHRFPCRSRFLRTLARSRVGSFDKMLDAAAALGFATAMDVSGVNIVGIEQQRDFARRGQLRWPRASALVECHDGNIHTTNFSTGEIRGEIRPVE
jgi:hypothetical protein